MADQKLEVLAGAAVIALAVGFALFAGRNTGISAQAGTYPLKASFRSVEGITVGADVKLAGVKVGTITSLALNPTTFMADATIAIDKQILLPTDSAIVISQDGLLGGNYVELLPGGMPDNLQPGQEIEDTQGAISLVNLLLKFVGNGSGSSDSSGSSNSSTPAPSTPAPATGGTATGGTGTAPTSP